jgi:hypothetical protein
MMPFTAVRVLDKQWLNARAAANGPLIRANGKIGGYV